MSPPELPVTPADVRSARERIAGIAVQTPTVPSLELGRIAGADVRLKLEGIQPTGSFKIRGATSRIRKLDEAGLRRGVVTASTGNHGRAVAHVAATLGIPAAICVSQNVPPGKVAALQALGCEVVVGGASQTEALATADQLVEQRGMTLVHPFDDPLVIAGQGTIGSEVIEQLPAVSTIVVPLSGGGLLAGIAVAAKAARPQVRLIGVAMERAAVMLASLSAGQPVELPEQPTLADSLQGGIGLTNATTFPIVQALMDEAVVLSEQEIWDGMRFAFDHHRLLLEGGAAVGIGAVLAGRLRLTSKDTVAIICSGANAESSQVLALAEGRVQPPA